MNFLESVVAEWYVYSGYFVRTNVRYNFKVKKTRAKGGFDAELDVLAYKPLSAELIHIETSGDGMAWTQRRERFVNKKFRLDFDDYKKIIGNEVCTLHRIAVVGYFKPRQGLDWATESGDRIEVKLIPNLFREISDSLRKIDFMKHVVPEGFPILRALQFAAAYCRDSDGTPMA